MSLVALVGIGSSLMTAPAAPAIRYERFAIGRAVYHTVGADLSSGDVSLETVHSRRLTSVWNLIANPRPAAAITGTFFSPGSQRPVADLIVDGNQVASGSIGTALGVTWYGQVSIFDQGRRDPVDWGTFRFGLRGGVRVVEDGRVRPNPRAQRFRDRRIWGRAARTGVGMTGDNRLILFATKSQVTLSEFGLAMRARGVREGISLDGGSSTCLFYQGALVLSPGRRLSNMLVLRYTSPIAAMLSPIESPASLDGPRQALPVALKPSLRPIKP